MTIDDQPRGEDQPVTPATERPLVEPTAQVAPPDPLDEVRAVAACLPNAADDPAGADVPTTEHEATGWRADPLAKP